MENPQVRNDITLQDLGDEIMLYDTDGEKVHVLNHTASVIWNLCDGRHSLEEMQQELIQSYPSISESDILADIRTALEDFKEKKLLI